MEAKWLYRLEATNPKNGLWYNEDSELVWGIGKLKNCKTKDLPMGYDERYHKDGRYWYSSYVSVLLRVILLRHVRTQI